MDNSNSTITELLKLITEKKKAFESLMELTLVQKKDIEENNAENIEKLVRQKQQIIDRVDEMDIAFSEGFALLKKQLKINDLEKADLSGYPMLKELKLKVADIMSYAKEIMAIEEENRGKLSSMLSDMKKDIKQINVGKRSIKAYENKPTYNDGIYIDKKK